MDVDLNDGMIIEVAVAGLKENGLAKMWASIISETKPGKPVKVLRLDEDTEGGVFYYIVPFMAGDRIPLAVKVGGNPLKFQQAIAAETIEEDVIFILPPTEARKRVIGTTISFEDGTSITLKEDNVPEQTPLLTWEPSVASFSPFWPFYQITINDGGQAQRGMQAQQGGQAQRTVFVRAFDGKTRPTLYKNVGGA